MADLESVRERMTSFAIMLGEVGVVVGGIWGFFSLLKMLFAA